MSDIKPEWITLIESFPVETSTLEIVAACINKFGVEESNMTFSSWGLVVRSYLEYQKQNPKDELIIKPLAGENYQNTTNYLQEHSIICNKLPEYYNNRNGILNPRSKEDSIITEKYIHHFNNLKVSNHMGRKAPHKYVLLISIFKLIGKRIINTNIINSSNVVETEFMINWNQYVPINTPFKPNYAIPFWYMKSEPFWKLYYANGELITNQWKSIINPAKQRKEIIAELNIELFDIIREEEYREILISHLISLIK